MRTAGSNSWRFEESVDRLPHLSLYVRDAFGLAEGADERIPPPLVGDIPDRSGELEDEVRVRAAAEWVGWWEAVTGLGHRDPTRLADGGAFGRKSAMRLMQFCDPPEWHSLVDLPALRGVVAAAFDEADQFATDIRRSLIRPERPPSVFRHPVVVRAVQAVAAECGAPIGSLHGAASVIFVRGPWWRIVGPGEILCSAVTADSDDDAYDALKAAFEPSE